MAKNVDKPINLDLNKGRSINKGSWRLGSIDVETTPRTGHAEVGPNTLGPSGFNVRDFVNGAVIDVQDTTGIGVKARCDDKNVDFIFSSIPKLDPFLGQLLDRITSHVGEIDIRLVEDFVECYFQAGTSYTK
jgi:hypothetical protein